MNPNLDDDRDLDQLLAGAARRTPPPTGLESTIIGALDADRARRRSDRRRRIVWRAAGAIGTVVAASLTLVLVFGPSRGPSPVPTAPERVAADEDAGASESTVRSRPSIALASHKSDVGVRVEPRDGAVALRQDSSDPNITIIWMLPARAPDASVEISQ